VVAIAASAHGASSSETTGRSSTDAALSLQELERAASSTDVAPLPRPERRTAFVASAGYTFLGRSGGPQFHDGPRLGIAIDFGREGWSAFSLELGASAALFPAGNHWGTLDSLLLTESLGLKWNLGRRSARRGYVLTGAAAVQEVLLEADGDPLQGNYGAALEVGLGWTPVPGRVEFRATRSLMVATSSLDAKTSLTVGYRF